MDRADDSSFPSFTRMSASTDGPNPLRPYYKPPSIGLPEPNPNLSGPASPPLAPRRIGSNSNRDFRDLLSDLDYGDYLPEASPSVADMAKKLVDRTIYSYTSTVMAQPFEVAKVVLQCYDAGAVAQSNTPAPTKGYFDQSQFGYSDSESDEDAPSYFVPTSPEETPSRKPFRKNTPSRTHSGLSSVTEPIPQTSTTLSLIRSDSVLEVISQIWTKEGAFGLWKGTNSTFVYGILLKTIETWTRSCLSAILNVPDPTFLASATRNITGPSVLDSPSPITSLTVVVLSAGIAGFILAPIDLVRTRLILTSVSSGPRALLPSLRALPSFSCPPQLLPITILHSTIPSLINTSFPLFLRTWLNIDPILTPTAYSISSFFTSLIEIFVKLPLETVLRRGHIASLNAPSIIGTASRRQQSPLLPLHTTGLSPRLKTIVPVGPYKGVLGTIFYIIHEEGALPTTGAPSTPRPSSSQPPRGRQGDRRAPQRQDKRGQGLKGVVRGWRVGFWALIGIYATAGLSASGNASTEF